LRDAKPILSITNNGLRNERGYLMSFPSNPQNKGYVYHADGICDRGCVYIVDGICDKGYSYNVDGICKKKDVHNVGGSRGGWDGRAM
jgi:hypothetical protein